MPPTLGLLDLPAPLFAWIDAGLAQALPPLGRLALWAVAAAVVSMALYRLLSPQATFALLKDESAAARAALAGYEGPLAGLWPYVGRALAPAGTQLRLALGPALLASLPVLVLMVWLGAHYGHHLPEPGECVTVQALRGTDAVVSRTVAWPDAAPPWRCAIPPAARFSCYRSAPRFPQSTSGAGGTPWSAIRPATSRPMPQSTGSRWTCQPHRT